MQQTRKQTVSRKETAMKSVTLALAAVLSLAGSAFAADWSIVSPGKDETVLIDRASIHQDGPVTKAWVMHSYSDVRTIGDTAFPHKSRVVLYEFQCAVDKLGFSQWSMSSGELGGGETVWADHVNGVSFYQAAFDPVSVKLVNAVCG
jgi:hypothetical protein